MPICRNEEGAACAHAKCLDNPQAFGRLLVAVEPGAIRLVRRRACESSLTTPHVPARHRTRVTTLSRLGELLVRRGQIDPAHLERAMTEQRTHGGALASHLVKLGFINEDALLSLSPEGVPPPGRRPVEPRHPARGARPRAGGAGAEAPPRSRSTWCARRSPRDGRPVEPARDRRDQVPDRLQRQDRRRRRRPRSSARSSATTTPPPTTTRCSPSSARRATSRSSSDEEEVNLQELEKRDRGRAGRAPRERAPHRRHQEAAPATSTSSPTRRCCASASASTACSTR